MNRFIVNKKSNTYADSLETYGLCNILHSILVQLNIKDVDVVIRDYYAYFEITLINRNDEQPYTLTEADLDKLNYFYLFKFIKQNDGTDLTGISEYYDYGRINKDIDAIRKSEKDEKITEQESKRKQKEKRMEIGPEYNVISLMAGKNQYNNFKKLFFHFHDKQNKFVDCVKCILSKYSTEPSLTSEFESVDVNRIQLYNPSCGKGANYKKAMFKDDNIKGEWISSTLYISGAQTDMVCSFIKKANKPDVKIVVPVYSEIKYEAKREVINEFRKKIRGSGSIQIDILNTLYLTETLLQRDGITRCRRKIRTIVSGLQTAYQMASQHVTSITNIGFIGLPNFVYISSCEENIEWLKFVQEHINIISSLTEKNDLEGLALYRDFISESSLDNFHAFTFWYASHIMSLLHEQKYVQSISKPSLNQFYKNMVTKELNLEEIVNNKGLQAVADAIRTSTVSIQRTEKSKRKYEIRYGLAQKLQIASNSKEDLATFVANFAMTYNAETARVFERDHKDIQEKDSQGDWVRSPITKNELESFYQLLSTYPSSLIGGLLGAYGFASNEHNNSNEMDTESTINNK